MNTKGYKSKKAIGILSAAVLAIACILYVWDIFGGGVPNSVSGCEFHFIDVGQGDASMFITDSGDTVVIDTGGAAAAVDTENYIKSYTDKIDYLILTHPHEDHIGGAAEIIENIKVDNILMTDAASDTYTFTNLLGAMDKSGANVICGKAGDSFSAGDIDITVLAPLHEFDNFNNYSMVVRIDYINTSALIAGDAEKASEKLMLRRWQENMLRADVLKLGHHGSSTSSGKSFVLAVDPRWAVISCGQDNSYGHPHDVTVELLEDYNIPYVRTDKSGSVVFISDGEHIEPVD